ncbi:MAG TPA: hypothetical protein VKY92_12365 [Verrucomicrobiae bacterium]|nr:hypothetical protein [Verrucomicrobiae bacterium]
MAAAWLGLVCFFLFVGTGRAIAATDTNDFLLSESTSLWNESMLWDKDIVVRSGIGYKDNVLLAPSGAQGSGFVASGLDLTLIRLPLDGLEFNLTLIGDDVRYFRAPGGLKGEDLFTANAVLQKYFGGVWRTGLELRYSYVDQVLQELLDPGGVQAVEAKANTLGVRPFLRRDLTTNWWVQVDAPLARDWWQAPLDPTWKLGGEAVVGYSYGPHSQLSLSGGAFYIPHSTWLARDASGNELAGRILSVVRYVAELKWEQQWDRSNHWTTAARLGFNYNRDNGGGFFNFYRYYALQELRFRLPNWDIKATAGASYYDFPIQLAGTSPGPTLHLATFNTGLRIERRLYKALRGFASFEFEETTSNDPGSEYSYKTVTGGLSWEF